MPMISLSWPFARCLSSLKHAAAAYARPIIDTVFLQSSFKSVQQSRNSFLLARGAPPMNKCTARPWPSLWHRIHLSAGHIEAYRASLGYGSLTGFIFMSRDHQRLRTKDAQELLVVG